MVFLEQAELGTVGVITQREVEADMNHLYWIRG